MKLLVVGGTGFFGKSIIDCFTDLKIKKFNISELIIISRDSKKLIIDFPKFNNPKIKYINADISKINSLPEAEIIIYAVGLPYYDKFTSNLNYYFKRSEKAILNFIKVVKKNSHKSKIVFCSSGSVYGKQPPNIHNIKESFSFQKISQLSEEKRAYAKVKRFDEKQIIDAGNFGLNTSIARCFSFYGEHLPTDLHFAYGNFIGVAKKGEDIVIKAQHQVIRSYMYADNLVYSLIKIALTANPTCPIYNVGSDEEISIFELADQIASKFDVKVLTSNKINLNIIDRYVPNIDKLKCLLSN